MGVWDSPIVLAPRLAKKQNKDKICYLLNIQNLRKTCLKNLLVINLQFKISIQYKMRIPLGFD